MLKKIYVGNLPFQTTEDEVRKLFAPYGAVESVDMITDRDTNQFRGFCFVEMEPKAAKAAIAGLKAHKIEGRAIKVSAARSAEMAESGNHPGSMLHMRTSRGQYGGHGDFAHSDRNSGDGSRHKRRR